MVGNEYRHFRSVRSLSDLGVRSEASEESNPIFRDFEAHSGDYATRNRGKMGRFTTAAIASS